MDPHIADQTPLDRLRAEHRVIERVLAVLPGLVARSEQGEQFETDSFRRCIEFFRHYADACHHAKEEDLVFPILEARGIPREGGPIGAMLHEHTVARRLTKEMHEVLEGFSVGDQETAARFRKTARQYAELLTDHIQKEDNVLFKMGDQVMSNEDRELLTSRFREVDSGSFGGKRREELEQIAEELETRWPHPSGG